MKFNSSFQQASFYIGRLSRQLHYRLLSLVHPLRQHGNVMMLHTGRSGSTLLGDMLDQHAGICWDGETIEKHFHYEAIRKRQLVRAQYGQYNLDQAIAAIRKKRRRLGGPLIFGSEMQPYHLRMLGTDLTSFLEMLLSLGFTRFIVLDRHNQLRKIVSHVAAYEHRAHHVPPGVRISTPKIHLDPNAVFIGYENRRLLDLLAEWDDFFATIRRWMRGRDCLYLNYEEDIEQDPRIAYAKACRFLGVPTGAPAIQFGRTGAFPLPEMISNYDEIRQLLTRTDHAWMSPPARAAASMPDRPGRHDGDPELGQSAVA